MSTEVGSLHYSLNLDTGAFDKALAGARKSMQSMRDSFEVSAQASQQFAAGLAATATAIGGVMFAGVKYAAELESLTVSLETVFGSTEKANEAMKEIKKTAQDSPFFDVKTLSQFVQVMGASGQAMEDAVKSGLRFGDVAAAFGKGNAELTRMGNTLSQVIGKGKADTVDFKELVNSGWVSIRTDVANSMGVSIQAFEEMVEAGEIGYDQISKAAEKFTGSAEKQSNGFNAIVQRMKESFLSFVGEIAIDIGLFDALKNAMNGIVTLMDTHKDSIKIAIVDGLNWVKQNGTIVAGVILGALAPAFLSLAFSIGAVLIQLLPFMALGAAVALVIQNWQVVSAFLSEKLNVLKERFQPLVDAGMVFLIWLREVYSEMVSRLKPAFDNLKAALIELWNALKPLQTVLELIAKILGGVIVIAIMAFIYALSILLPMVVNVFASIVRIIAGAAQLITNAFKVVWGALDVVKSVLQLILFAIQDFFGSVGRFIGGKTESIANGIIAPFKKAFDFIKNSTGSVKDALSRLNPFHRESPSLVDWVKKGTGVIKSEYSNLFSDMDGLTANVRPSLINTLSPNGDVPTVQQPLQVSVNAGAFMGSPSEAREFARMIESEMTKIKIIGGAV